MFLRVISGSVRGKKLLCAEGTDVRPTLDRVKESVFNMLAFDIPDACVLDLFSGSGSLGIEALSRGARHCTFIDNAEKSVAITKKNIESTHFDSLSTVLKCDSIDYISKTDKQFDIIFIDPPYESDLYFQALDKIRQKGILAENGLIVLEYDLELTPHFNTDGFEIIKDKKYGRVKILIMKE